MPARYPLPPDPLDERRRAQQKLAQGVDVIVVRDVGEGQQLIAEIDKPWRGRGQIEAGS